MSWACCSPATATTPTGTARSCRSSEARALAPYNNATSLQVTVSVLAGMVWAMENPNSRTRRAGRDGFPAQPGDLHAVPGQGGRRVHRLDAAESTASACSRRTWTRPIPGSSRTCASRGYPAPAGVAARPRSRSGAGRPAAPAVPPRPAPCRAAPRASGASMLMYSGAMSNSSGPTMR